MSDIPLFELREKWLLKVRARDWDGALTLLNQSKGDNHLQRGLSPSRNFKEAIFHLEGATFVYLSQHRKAVRCFINALRFSPEGSGGLIWLALADSFEILKKETWASECRARAQSNSKRWLRLLSEVAKPIDMEDWENALKIIMEVEMELIGEDNKGVERLRKSLNTMRDFITSHQHL